MKLRIGHRRYTVRSMTKAELATAEAVGFCMKEDAEIAVSPKGTSCDQAETLLHEVLHAVWDSVGLPDQVDEERAVTMLAKGLCQVLLDNPVFHATLLAGLVDEVRIFGSTTKPA